MEARAKKRILVVDDSPTILKILGKGIESLGYEVVQANDGQEALHVLDEIPVDLVMTDINMPNIDGFELIRRIRKRPDLTVLPVIVLTSETGDKAMGQALDVGANIYLTKPASLPKLKYKVQSLLGEAAPPPPTQAKLSSTLEAASKETDALEHARVYRRQTEKLRMLAPDVQIEMCLFADTDIESQMVQRIMLERREVSASDVLPLLMDETLEKEQVMRLLRLMGGMKASDFAMPLLHLYSRTEDIEVKAELIKTVARCGKGEFRKDIEELYHGEASTTIKMDEPHAQLFSAFEKALELATAAEDE
ncbi:MAG: response regulator [Planctomycetes bacterium]|nr:response regulator [Planctomycetota bacterium]NUQ33984.1 response regulator [Planctomycetaceae bacterium]